jgi:hypothetical protein
MGVIWAVGVWRMGWFACGVSWVPPAGRGNRTAWVPLTQWGEPAGGGQKQHFRTPSGVGRGCSKNGCSCVVFDKGIHQPPLFGAPKRLFAGRIPPLPYPLPPCSRGERAGMRGDSSSPRCFGIFVSTRCTLIRPNGGKNRPHFRTPSANPLTNAPEMGYNRGDKFCLPFLKEKEGQRRGGRSKQESSARRRKHKIGEAEANSPHPNPLPPSSRGEREEGSGGSIQKQVVTHDGKGTMRHNELWERAGRRTDVLVSQVRGVVLPRSYLRRLLGQQTPLPQKARREKVRMKVFNLLLIAGVMLGLRNTGYAQSLTFIEPHMGRNGSYAMAVSDDGNAVAGCP